MNEWLHLPPLLLLLVVLDSASASSVVVAVEVVRGFFGAGSSDDVAAGKLPSPQSPSRSGSGCSCLIAIEDVDAVAPANEGSVTVAASSGLLLCWPSVSSAVEVAVALLLELLPSGLVLDGQWEVEAFSDSGRGENKGNLALNGAKFQQNPNLDPHLR